MEKGHYKFNDWKHPPEKWVSNYVNVCICTFKKFNWKKGLYIALHLDALFQTNKKYLYVVWVPTEKSWNRNWKTINREKSKKIFFGFSKTTYVFGQVITEIIKISHQRRDIGKGTISFLKDLKTGYLPIHFSPFRSFSRKLTFFWVSGRP